MRGSIKQLGYILERERLPKRRENAYVAVVFGYVIYIHIALRNLSILLIEDISAEIDLLTKEIDVSKLREDDEEIGERFLEIRDVVEEMDWSIPEHIVELELKISSFLSDFEDSIDYSGEHMWDK